MPFSQPMDLDQLLIQEKNKSDPLNNYVMVGGGVEGEWIRMEWRADVPVSKRDSLLAPVEP